MECIWSDFFLYYLKIILDLPFNLQLISKRCVSAMFFQTPTLHVSDGGNMHPV